MANGIVNDASLQGIANAIRMKNELTNKYKPADMPQAIEDIALGVDTSDATAGEYNVSKDKTAYAKGEKITGTLEDTVTEYPTTKPSETTYTKNIVNVDLSDYSNNIKMTYIPDETTGKDGIILRPNITLKQPHTTITGLEDLKAENIKKDISIAGVIGTLEKGIKIVSSINELTTGEDNELAVVMTYEENPLANYISETSNTRINIIRIPKEIICCHNKNFSEIYFENGAIHFHNGYIFFEAFSFPELDINTISNYCCSYGRIESYDSVEVLPDGTEFLGKTDRKLNKYTLNNIAEYIKQYGIIETADYYYCNFNFGKFVRTQRTNPYYEQTPDDVWSYYMNEIFTVIDSKFEGLYVYTAGKWNRIANSTLSLVDENKILSGYSIYANNGIIEGKMSETHTIELNEESEKMININGNSSWLNIDISGRLNNKNILLKSDSMVSVICNIKDKELTELSKNLGINENIIKKGEIILGVEGTYDVDLTEVKTLTNDILGKEEA